MPEYHGWTHAPKAQGGTDPIPNAGLDLTNMLRARMSGYSFAAAQADILWFQNGEGGSTNVSTSYYEDPAATDGVLRILQTGVYWVQFGIDGYSLDTKDTYLDGFISADNTGGGTAPFWSSSLDDDAGFTKMLRAIDSGGGDSIDGTPFAPLLLYCGDSGHLPVEIAWHIGYYEDNIPVVKTVTLTAFIVRLGDYAA